jgi:uncharacterized protein YjbJ (UPF0337 family)
VRCLCHVQAPIRVINEGGAIAPGETSRVHETGHNYPKDGMSDNNKDTGPEAGVKGAVEGVKGKVKEVVGTASGKDELRREGKAQQDKADSQREVATKEAEADKARAEAKVHEADQRSHQD